jgi:subtilisin-like proprotein convertase family protein
VPRLRPQSVFLLVSIGLVACARGEEDAIPRGIYPPLSPASRLLAGVPPAPPSSGRRPLDVLPPKLDLLSTQSPVKDQGARGVCSYFATVALMEQLYRAASPPESPLLSEQYAIWLVATKGTVRDSIFYDLDVYQKEGGLIGNAVWPYNPTPWSAPAHPECDTATPPDACETQGNPPAAVASAKRWLVGGPDTLSAQPDTIKHYLFSTGQALVLGMPVHCQAWSYADGCSLPTDSSRYEMGVITYPTPEDLQSYAASPAQLSHALLLVGWDDTFEVTRRDAKGKTILDAKGKPEKERGFYLAKNSWGTDLFGSTSPVEPGYALISQRYVEEFGRLVTAQRQGGAELCGDDVDNDKNGYMDCDDLQCTDAPGCAGKALTFSAPLAKPVPIPDGKSASSVLWVASAGRIANLAVAVDISHPSRRQLVVELASESGEGSRSWTLFSGDGPDGPDLKRTFPVSTVWGAAAARGKWELKVKDTVTGKFGTLNGWQVLATTCSDSTCPNERVEYLNPSDSGVCFTIPDGDAAGLMREIYLPGGLDVSSLTTLLTLDHPRASDLRVTLARKGQAGIVLMDGTSVPGPFVDHELPVVGLAGGSAGTYQLRVEDLVAGQAGSLCGWLLAGNPL